MGFYGNITNTSRTQFQFDKIYPSRRVMEESMQGDGVFVGRYVLVEYDSDVTNVYKQRLYRNDDDYFGENNQFYYLYTDVNLERRVQYKTATEDDTSINYGVTGDNRAYKGAIAYVVEASESTTYYQCVGESSGNAVFQLIDTNSNYVFNYSQDKEWATEKGYADIGRGWDSTVWQKVYANGLERYVMIAELNSVVPTFDISADAPSISPITPHFDENSTNVYYNLHWQPQWGIRVKSAYGDLKGNILENSGKVDENLSNILIDYSDNTVNYPSDTNINWDKYEYDKSTGQISHYSFGLLDNDNHNGTWVDIEDNSSINSPNIVKAENGMLGAIYFNKDGLKVDEITKSSDLFDENYRKSKFSYVSPLDDWPGKQLKDEIRLVPTGYSGHKYNQHYGVFDKAPDVDTYELSIMLPSVGDTISDIWDLIYGNREVNGGSERNLDITWKDASQGQTKSGLRLVDLKDGQFSYEVNKVNTLAGCINSAHDIMGMIVQDTRLEKINPINFSIDTDDPEVNEANQETLNNLSSEYIYYYGNTYYRKRKYYDYIREPNSELKNYEKIDSIIPFQNNTYYDKVVSNYLLLEQPPEDNHTVYTITGNLEQVTSSGHFSQTYVPNRFYYKTLAYSVNGVNHYNYTLETDLIQDNTKNYVTLYNYDEDGNYVEVTENDEVISRPIQYQVYFYKPGAYYYFPSEDNNGTIDENELPQPDNNAYEDEPINPNRVFYVRTVTRERNIVTNEWIETYNFAKIPSGQLIKFESGKYYKLIGSTYRILQSQPTNLENGRFVLEECYTLPWLDREESNNVYFYQSGLYYYEDNGNYLLDTNSTYTEGRTYYKAPSVEALENTVFYKPGVYYVTNDAATEPTESATVTSDAFDPQKVYWKKADWYVASDSNNIYAVGMKWDKSVAVPNDVTLCNRTERWGVEELKGFATKINTMLGMILRIRAMLDEEHSDTRDNTTVQGCINLINDIIAKFGERKVADLMITNNYGQVAGARQTTAQLYQYNNIGTGVATPSTLQGIELTDEDEDQWIYWNVNPNYSDPVITLKHKLVSEGHAATATTTTANLNDTTSGNGLNKGNIDTLELYTPIVDIAGHVVGQNTETVTLPFGFKILKSLAQSEDGAAWSTAAGVESNIVADNTQDTLQVATGNKWIRVVTDAANDKITFAHETHSVTPTTSTATLSNETSTTVTFNVPTYSFDTAGHYNGLDTKTITMPFGYGKITDDAGTTVSASATFDTLSIVSGDNWLTTTATADTITITHDLVAANTGSYGDANAQSPNFGSKFSVPYITVDAAGHVTGVSAHDVTIPKGSLTTNSTPNTDTGNILTGLTFVDTTGAITVSQQNVGTLKLVNYSLGTDTSEVKASDTINGAFSKLQANINNFGDIVSHNVSEFESAGAAAAVLGTSSDAATANTVYGAKAYADSLVSEIPECEETTDGVYILKCTINSGDKTYEWIEEV